ncbi:hypothetical protein ECG_09759 [Echinococcus granulosus]|uniref:EGF region n=1 Tax=Echinococcus granulosus TaxID=6210 RepID=U6FVD7_ECHGR|nr:hypothetical protein ECG_09759 [Echinococcus granulosus]CDI70106.1 EGF region [Echinococcus granulosus]
MKTSVIGHRSNPLHTGLGGPSQKTRTTHSTPMRKVILPHPCIIIKAILTTSNPPIPLPCPPLVRGGSITTSKHNSTATHGNMLLQILVISALLTSQSKGFDGSSTAQESLVDVDLGLDGVEEGLGVRKRVMLLPLTGNGATERLRRLIYEVVHCMRPCLNNGIMILPRNTVDVCRCICPPSHYGIACEYEISGEVKTRRQLF